MRAQSALGHALLAAANLEQLSVLFHRPAVRQALGLESGVEGDAVAVALRVRQHAVAVEQQRCGARRRVGEAR
jgi:hypothetical protein